MNYTEGFILTSTEFTATTTIRRGEAKVLCGDSNVLTHHSDNAVAQRGADTYWKIKPVNEKQCMIIVFISRGGEQDMAATLNSGGDSDGAINVIMRPAQNPPSPEQLWSLEESVVATRYPPIVKARIQSCAKPDMSMAIAGVAPLPMTMQSVACVPTDSVDKDQLRWTFDYRLDTPNKCIF